MVAPEVQGIDLFKIAGRSISGWVPSLKTGTVIRQPFCSQLEERLLLWLEYHPLVVNYARGDIGPEFATKYRLPIPQHAPFAIGYTFENKPHHYLPDFVGTLADGTSFLAEAGMDHDLVRMVEWECTRLAHRAAEVVRDAARTGLFDLGWQGPVEPAAVGWDAPAVGSWAR